MNDEKHSASAASSWESALPWLCLPIAGKHYTTRSRALLLVLVPGLTGGQEFVWVCGHAQAPEGLTMPTGNYTRLTGIPDKYLPIACRGIR